MALSMRSSSDIRSGTLRGTSMPRSSSRSLRSDSFSFLFPSKMTLVTNGRSTIAT